MKIGIDGRAAKWYRGTGIGTYTYQLINYINNVDKMNKYKIFMPSECNNMIKFNDNFSISKISSQNQSNNFWDGVNICNPLSESNLQLYHVPQNGVGLPLEKNCSFVITLHDVIPYRMPETTSDNYRKIFNETLPKIVSLCDGIITVSNFSKQDIIKAFNFPEEKIFVTHLASEDIYKPKDEKISKLLIEKQYSIKDDFILYVGGFSPRKNIIGLIEAFSKLISFYKKDIKLVIAGKKGKSYSLYKKRCEELNIADKVIFSGFIELNHLPYFYSACKLFVYPSFYEGFGLPPIEAMACDCPVITSNTTSIPEVVLDSALLIDPHNIDDLCSSMYEVLVNDTLRNSLIKKGSKRASELTWEKTALDTISAYSQIINNEYSKKVEGI
ncbi:glycosyltransferase family 4 protein [Clostridium tetani]|uniref:Glycosyltransferase family 1 protein n=1 Tax=Clostridium tetani TaxID=1513 RepID=A0ABY0ESH2_CLOTA|nr:glycosyltransferase family 1 protein [Clostridium tetani]CDI48326.1 mannosyltransferase [Clostridium tetani 12124569]KHO40337.1 glycosyl transferase [Clostridium tetani]RXI41079.1 glycosyltransferase family 1 protein [Clostridium tetani]RXI58504.1 glycosyltransferase family 1 protein [Clostridium tetani]RXI73216.1 glycosyltransferase family 1 protein [Clostridium tetani]